MVRQLEKRLGLFDHLTLKKKYQITDMMMIFSSNATISTDADNKIFAAFCKFYRGNNNESVV